MLGLIGPDGAGKTTTIRVLLGLLAPNRGRVETCGLDPLARRYELSQKVGYLSQRFSLYGDLTVNENIAFFAEIHQALAPGGQMLMAEPPGHVSSEAFEESVRTACAAGFTEVSRPSIRKSHAVVLRRSS